MNRREAMLALAATSALGAGSVPLSARAQVLPLLTPLATGTATSTLNIDIYYEVYGNSTGPNLFLATPIVATLGLWTASYLAQFVDRYRVLIADYPYAGRSGSLTNPSQFTADQVCSDYLTVADAADMNEFAIAGYSWGGNSSLQLATQSSRVTALAVGGWPALGGPYAELLQLSQDLAAIDFLNLTGVGKYVAYYGSLQSWPEYAEISTLTCPRLNYVDSQDDGTTLGLPTGGIIAPTTDMIGRFRANRAALDSLGWQTLEVNSGLGHSGGLLPSIAGPVLRAFFDAHT